MVENLEVWVGGIVGFIVFLWPEMLMFKTKRLTQAELVEISSEYDGVNVSYFVHILLSLSVAIPLIIFLPDIAQLLGTEHVGMVKSVWIIVLFSCLSIVRGMVAMKMGVYPTSKFFGSLTRYAYDDTGRISRLGRLQVYVAGAASAAAILIGAVRWWSVQ